MIHPSGTPAGLALFSMAPLYRNEQAAQAGAAKAH